MDKKIPIYFDSVIVSSPLEKISESNQNLGRLKVRVFTKYGNRNGSYITDAVAEQLIASATSGNTPVVGFFDPQSQSWASHTGPTLANGYGYVENFEGWQPFEDTDGVTRDYAVFSIVLFTNYFEEAQKVLGQNQSMELNPESITGDWAYIENQEYFVYKTAEMLGFCIIGEHEPCFSVSSFFSKNDDIYNSQQEKFSSLLFDLKAQVEEAEKNNEGGEQPMNELENMTLAEETQVVEEPQVEETVQEETTEFEAAETVEETSKTEEVVEEKTAEEVDTFAALQQQFNELQESYNTLKEQYDAAQNKLAEAETFQNTANQELETLRTENEQLKASVASYEAKSAEVEQTRKEELISEYEKILSTEEITEVQNSIKDFSYDELESKLAIQFARQQMAQTPEKKKVPLVETQESPLALILNKYRKN